MSSSSKNSLTPQYTVTTPGNSTAPPVNEDQLFEQQTMKCSNSDIAFNEETSIQKESRCIKQQMISSQKLSSSLVTTSSARSQSLQSSSSITLESNYNEQQMSKSSAVHSQTSSKTFKSTTELSQSTNGNSSVMPIIGTEKQTASSRSSSIQQQKSNCTMAILSSSSTSSSLTSKGKFQSFLQQPDAALGGSGNFLTTHQKHVRNFGRSTSTQADTTPISTTASNSSHLTLDKNVEDVVEHTSSMDTHSSENITSVDKKQHLSLLSQSSNMNLSKSAEAIEVKSSVSGICAVSSTSAVRTQLTFSGGMLAPTGRRITILSPMHAPMGLHDLQKRTGRSPLSPRISLPGNDIELFG